MSPEFALALHRKGLLHTASRPHGPIHPADDDTRGGVQRIAPSAPHFTSAALAERAARKARQREQRPNAWQRIAEAVRAMGRTS